MRQRKAYIDTLFVGETPRGTSIGYVPIARNPRTWPLSKFLGDRAVREINLPGATDAELQIAKDLFPEAKVSRAPSRGGF